MNSQRQTLTPALSRPTGEGESFSGVRKNRHVKFAGALPEKWDLPNALPLPSDGRGVRVRANLLKP